MARIFISTAEPSAERHASHVVEALRRLRPGVEINAAGGQILSGAGAALTVDMTGQAVMGLWEALSHLSFYRRAEQSILEALARDPHDALVVVDAASFHLHVAKKARQRFPDVPILYYCPPKLWAWKEWRVKSMRRDITRTMCIFPFEQEFFQARGVDAVYVGNPTLDQVNQVDGSAMTRTLGVDGIQRHSDPAHGVLAVFPGSRRSEVKYLWPVMVETIDRLHSRFPELKTVVALAPGWNRERLAEFAPIPDQAECLAGQSQELLAASSVVLAKSGTTTLEAALLGKPMAVCYAADNASYMVVKMFVKVRNVSLPNLVAGKRIVKEFIQHDATPENLAGEIGRLLTDHRYYRSMRKKLLNLRSILGEQPAALRAASEILSFVEPG